MYRGRIASAFLLSLFFVFAIAIQNTSAVVRIEIDASANNNCVNDLSGKKLVWISKCTYPNKAPNNGGTCGAQAPCSGAQTLSGQTLSVRGHCVYDHDCKAEQYLDGDKWKNVDKPEGEASGTAPNDGTAADGTKPDTGTTGSQTNPAPDVPKEGQTNKTVDDAFDPEKNGGTNATKISPDMWKDSLRQIESIGGNYTPWDGTTPDFSSPTPEPNFSSWDGVVPSQINSLDNNLPDAVPDTPPYNPSPTPEVTGFQNPSGGVPNNIETGGNTFPTGGAEPFGPQAPYNFPSNTGLGVPEQFPQSPEYPSFYIPPTDTASIWDVPQVWDPIGVSDVAVADTGENINDKLNQIANGPDGGTNANTITAQNPTSIFDQPADNSSLQNPSFPDEKRPLRDFVATVGISHDPGTPAIWRIGSGNSHVDDWACTTVGCAVVVAGPDLVKEFWPTQAQVIQDQLARNEYLASQAAEDLSPADAPKQVDPLAAAPIAQNTFTPPVAACGPDGSWIDCMKQQFGGQDLQEASMKSLESKWNFGNIMNCSGGQCNGTKAYDSPQEGAVADFQTIAKRIEGGDDTLNKLMNRLSPPNENDTRGMVSYLSNKLGVAPDEKLDFSNQVQMANLFNEKSFLEHSVRATDVMASRDIIDAYETVAASRGIQPNIITENTEPQPSIQNLGSDASAQLTGGVVDERTLLSADIVPAAENPRIAESAAGPTVESVRDINFAGLSGIHTVETGAPLPDITPDYNSLIPKSEWAPVSGEQITREIQDENNAQLARDQAALLAQNDQTEVQIAADSAAAQTARDQAALMQNNDQAQGEFEAQQQVQIDQNKALADRLAQADEDAAKVARDAQIAQDQGALIQKNTDTEARLAQDDADARAALVARDQNDLMGRNNATDAKIASDAADAQLAKDQAALIAKNDGVAGGFAKEQSVLNAISKEQSAAQTAVEAAQKRLDAAKNDANIAELKGEYPCVDTGFIQCPTTAAERQLAVAQKNLDTVKNNYDQCASGKCSDAIVAAQAQAEKGQGGTSAVFKAAENSFAADMDKRITALKEGSPLMAPVHAAYALTDGIGYLATNKPRTILEGTAIGEYLGFRAAPEDAIANAANPNRDLADKISAGRDIAMFTVPVAADLSIGSRGIQSLSGWTQGASTAERTGAEVVAGTDALDTAPSRAFANDNNLPQQTQRVVGSDIVPGESSAAGASRGGAAETRIDTDIPPARVANDNASIPPQTREVVISDNAPVVKIPDAEPANLPGSEIGGQSRNVIGEQAPKIIDPIEPVAPKADVPLDQLSATEKDMVNFRNALAESEARTAQTQTGVTAEQAPAPGSTAKTLSDMDAALAKAADAKATAQIEKNAVGPADTTLRSPESVPDTSLRQRFADAWENTKDYFNIGKSEAPVSAEAKASSDFVVDSQGNTKIVNDSIPRSGETLPPETRTGSGAPAKDPITIDGTVNNSRTIVDDTTPAIQTTVNDPLLTPQNFNNSSPIRSLETISARDLNKETIEALTRAEPPVGEKYLYRGLTKDYSTPAREQYFTSDINGALEYMSKNPEGSIVRIAVPEEYAGYANANKMTISDMGSVDVYTYPKEWFDPAGGQASLDALSAREALKMRMADAIADGTWQPGMSTDPYAGTVRQLPQEISVAPGTRTVDSLSAPELVATRAEPTGTNATTPKIPTEEPTAPGNVSSADRPVPPTPESAQPTLDNLVSEKGSSAWQKVKSWWDDLRGAKPAEQGGSVDVVAQDAALGEGAPPIGKNFEIPGSTAVPETAPVVDTSKPFVQDAALGDGAPSIGKNFDIPGGSKSAAAPVVEAVPAVKTESIWSRAGTAVAESPVGKAFTAGLTLLGMGAGPSVWDSIKNPNTSVQSDVDGSVDFSSSAADPEKNTKSGNGDGGTTGGNVNADKSTVTGEAEGSAEATIKTAPPSPTQTETPKPTPSTAEQRQQQEQEQQKQAQELLKQKQQQEQQRQQLQNELHARAQSNPGGQVLSYDSYCIKTIQPINVQNIPAGTPFPSGCYNNPNGAGNTSSPSGSGGSGGLGNIGSIVQAVGGFLSKALGFGGQSATCTSDQNAYNQQLQQYQQQQLLYNQQMQQYNYSLQMSQQYGYPAPAAPTQPVQPCYKAAAATTPGTQTPPSGTSGGTTTGSGTSGTKPIVASVSFIANPSTVASGNTAVLSWAAIGSAACTITAPDASVVTKGSFQGSFTTGALTATTKFSIACDGGTGTSSAQTTVTVK